MIFWTCLFEKELHYREIMREFLFALCIAIYVAKAVPLRATKALWGGGGCIAPTHSRPRY
jgi:hypothetical protein